MSEKNLLHLLRVQLSSIPVVNQEVKKIPLAGGRLEITVPMKEKWWSRGLKHLLPLRKEKELELDPMGIEVFSLFDGKRTVEEIADIHKERWNLSFFESRGMILEFLKRLMKESIIALVAPPEEEE